MDQIMREAYQFVSVEDYKKVDQVAEMATRCIQLEFQRLRENSELIGSPQKNEPERKRKKVVLKIKEETIDNFISDVQNEVDVYSIDE
jgi:hypothetical protein